MAGQVLRVGPEEKIRTVAEAARKARDGDIVEIVARDYRADVAVWTQDGITVRGVGGRARLIADGARIVVYKMGEKGAITITPMGEFATGIYRTEALKPTGAGDSFLGAFVAALAEGRPLREAVLRGSAAAAIVVARVACAPAMPTRTELDDFLATRPAL